MLLLLNTAQSKFYYFPDPFWFGVFVGDPYPELLLPALAPFAPGVVTSEPAPLPVPSVFGPWLFPGACS